MFHDKSRYAKIPTDPVITPEGREVTAIRLRRLPATAGDPQVVSQEERLDLRAQRHYGNGTKFWHIADANSALEAKALVARVLNTFKVPRS
jgi:hypothetical protein